MKIAYLILAHGNYRHLRRLISALDDDGSHFYIHIDKKSPLPEWKDVSFKIHFIPDRVRVYWAGFSQVQATLNLLKAAVTGSHDYFAIISGADYPIQPKGFLLDKLSSGKEFINLHSGFQSHKPEHRLSNFHFQKFDRKNRRKPLSIFFLGIEKLLAIAGYRRNLPENVGSGSSWFILSEACVRFILKYLELHPNFKNHFRHALSPDEYFFQTIINQSSFAHNTAAHLTYTDWKEGEGSPAMIDQNHLDYLITEQQKGTLRYYFARKFDDSSEDMVKKIDKLLIK